jgi:hypothetical protein
MACPSAAPLAPALHPLAPTVIRSAAGLRLVAGQSRIVSPAGVIAFPLSLPRPVR